MNSEEVWNKYSSKLKNYIMSNISDKYEAEDILQEVGVRIKKYEDKIKNIKNVEAWLFKVSKNLITDHYRNKNKTLLVEDINTMEIVSPSEEVNFNTEVSSCLLKLVEYLPPSYKEAIIESDYHGEKQTVLGQKWGLSSSGSKNRVQRARKKLRATLLGCCEVKYDNLGNIIEFNNKNNKENKFPCIKC